MDLVKNLMAYFRHTFTSTSIIQARVGWRDGLQRQDDGSVESLCYATLLKRPRIGHLAHAYCNADNNSPCASSFSHNAVIASVILLSVRVPTGSIVVGVVCIFPS